MIQGVIIVLWYLCSLAFECYITAWQMHVRLVALHQAVWLVCPEISGVFSDCEASWGSAGRCNIGGRNQISNDFFHAFRLWDDYCQLDWDSFWCIYAAWVIMGLREWVRKRQYLQYRCPQLCVGWSFHALGSYVLCKHDTRRCEGSRTAGEAGRGRLLCAAIRS